MSRAQLLESCGRPLRLVDRPVPEPGAGQVLLRVRAGPGVALAAGTRLGVPWLGWTCGRCGYCTSGHENLCDGARFTGWQLDGGYAEHVVADARYCFPLPPALDDAHAAPLLCAGVIGWRALRAAGDAQRLGVYGFGAAGHLVAQIALVQGRRVHAYTRPGDVAAQEFARSLGVQWAGDSGAAAPGPLDAAIIFAPVGALVPVALRAVRKGGTVVCGGIHMSDVPQFPYADLWGERVVRSVANLTRQDARELLEFATRVPLHVQVEVLPLTAANEALARLRRGELTGAAVLVP